MFARSLICLLLITFCLAPNVHSDGRSAAGGVPLLVDPQHRGAEQLLRDANDGRSANRLVEAATLSYLALRAAEAEKETSGSLKARTHLLLSEIHGELGYRALERIHAKAAYRERGRDAKASAAIEPGWFEQRLGIVAMRAGDFSVAEHHFRRALEAFEAAKAPDPRRTASALVALAELAIQEANIRHILDPRGLSTLQSVQAYLDRALSLLGTSPEDRQLRLAIYELQAQLLVQLSGQVPADHPELARNMLAGAEKLFRDTLNLRRRDPGSGLRQQVSLINGLISVMRRTGRYVDAMSSVEEALGLTNKLQTVDIDVVMNMALVAERLKREDLTLKLCNIVMNQEEARYREMSSMSSAALAIASSAQGRHRSMICLSLLGRSAAGDDKRARQMLDMVLRRKAIVTDAEAVFWKTLHEQSAADLQGARSNLLSLRNLLGAKVVKGDGKDLWRLINVIEGQEEVLSVEPWWRVFQSAPAHADARKSLADYGTSILKGGTPWDALSTQERRLEEKTIDVDSVAGKLPSASVLVEFARIDDFELERELFTGNARYWALILFPGGRTKAIELGVAEQIESKITASLSVLHSGDRLLVDPQLQAMSSLYDALWSPIAETIGRTESIILSPDAALALVPFGALLAPDSRFVIERHTLYQVTSGREFVMKRKEAKDTRPGHALIVADPDYSAAPDRSAPSRADFSAAGAAVSQPLARLAETLTEGKMVKGILGEDAELLTRANASEAKVRSAKSPPVLHLATHGLFFKELAKPPKGDLGPEDIVALDAAYVRHVRSLSRSGLALSGINSGGGGNDDDGFLTAFDVASMELSGTWLVVLSGCDTGLGDPLAGEGVLGLHRSFRIAGARYVVMSLWRLSDKEAVRQMRIFYAAFQEGRHPILALRDMQRERISRLREALGKAPPALWGALTIQGI